MMKFVYTVAERRSVIAQPAGQLAIISMSTWQAVYRPTASGTGNSMQSARVAGFITLVKATTVYY
jgi:hypothetical protein